jgi:signal transduction histidine kinase
MDKNAKDQEKKFLSQSFTSELNIPDFCDMKSFDKMMRDWSNATGLATVAVGRNGKYISGYYNFTVFCEGLTRKSEEGLRRCIECDKAGSGVYLCHAGLVDFAAPITLEDGTVLGNIVGGQVLPEKPNEAYFRATARELGIDEETYLRELRKVNIRTREQIHASFDLLTSVVNLFVRTSYAAKMNTLYLAERSRLISSLGKLYFADFFIDIPSHRFMALDIPEYVVGLIQGFGDSLTKFLEKGPEAFAESEWVKPLKDFFDLRTLPARLQKRQSLSFDYISHYSGWCRVSFVLVRADEEGFPAQMILTFQLIQEEKTKEIQSRIALEEALKEAKSASQAKTDFLSRMSHDIRTPLNGIMGMTYLASQENNPLRTQDCLKKIDTSSHFLLGLINDILDMSKVESNKIVLHPEVYPPDEFVDYINSVIRPLCQEKGIHFTMDLDLVKDRVPLVDKLRINQIVFNLLSNAVKFTPEGGDVRYSAS